MAKSLLIAVVLDEHVAEAQKALSGLGEARVWDPPEEPSEPDWRDSRRQRSAHRDQVGLSLQRFLNTALSELDVRLTTGTWILRRARARIDSLTQVPERTRTWLLRRIASADDAPPRGDDLVGVEDLVRDLDHAGLGATEISEVTGVSWIQVHRILYPQREREPPPPLTEASGVDELELSVRAANVLQNLGIQTVGELTQPGMVDRIRAAKNAGRKTLAEIDCLLQNALGRGLGASTRESKNRDLPLEVPPYARSYSWTELPVSTRVRGALARAGVAVLGDVHGMTRQNLREKVPRLGRNGARQVAGVFAKLSRYTPVLPTELLGALDRAIRGLSDYDRDVLLLSLGAERDPMTFVEVGARFERSREAIRQTEARAITRLRAIAGPAFGAALRALLASGGSVEGLCASRDDGAKPSYAASFYERLVARLGALAIDREG